MTMAWRLIGVPLDCHANFTPEARTQHSLVLYCGGVTIELACSTMVVVNTTSGCSHSTSVHAPWTGHLSFVPLVLILGGLTKRHVACGFPNCTTEYCGRMFLETRSSKEALGKPHCATAAGAKDGASTEAQSC
ncbi:hypothetical protein BKA82DRAFT_1003477 [Pisolithus tinctorius]|nr:hypothetical protein BKA82DRAFT_1003477 [Pisolithus tinctorius]